MASSPRFGLHNPGLAPGLRRHPAFAICHGLMRVGVSGRVRACVLAMRFGFASGETTSTIVWDDMALRLCEFYSSSPISSTSMPSAGVR